MLIFLDVLLLVGFTFLLIKMTDLVVEGLSTLSESARLAKYGLGAFLLALSTSFPELFVGITSAWNHAPSLSLGNVIGSNIANVSLVMGGAALISGSVGVVGDYLKRDFIFAFLAGSLPLLLLIDGGLSRLDGVILLLVYGYYVFSVFHKKHAKAVKADKLGLTGRLLRKLKLFGTSSSRTSISKVLLGMALVLFSAEMVVRLAKHLAVELHLPVLLVGLFIVAIGTSLPELALEIRAIAKREVALVFGNLLGSTVANSTLIIGITALIAPIEVVAINSYLIATIAYVALFWLFWVLTKTKRRLDRWEGAVMIVAYLAFFAVELAKSNGYGEIVMGWLGLR